jgi:hypothetical protein
MFGPHATGAERFVVVSSGPSLAQVAGAILGEQARVENPDKDEVPVQVLAGHHPTSQVTILFDLAWKQGGVAGIPRQFVRVALQARMVE